MLSTENPIADTSLDPFGRTNLFTTSPVTASHTNHAGWDPFWPEHARVLSLDIPIEVISLV